MEEENLNTEVEEVNQNQLNKVTPLSKYLAMALFIILPFVGGWIGYNYAPEVVVEVEKVIVVKEVEKQTNEMDQVDAYGDWNLHTNLDIGFTVSYPTTYHPVIYEFHPDAEVKDPSRLANYNEKDYEKGYSQGVLIDFTTIHHPKADKYDLSLDDDVEAYVEFLNSESRKTIALTPNNPQSSELTPVSIGHFSFKETIFWGPGGEYDFYHAFIDGKEYTAYVWGYENEPEIVESILASFTVEQSSVEVADGMCFEVNSHTSNQKTSFPAIITGTIDNSSADCNWLKLEGKGGVAQLYFYNEDLGWSGLNQPTSILVDDWMSDLTDFSVKLNFNNSGIGLPNDTLLKVVFSEEDPSGKGNVETVELELVLK